MTTIERRLGHMADVLVSNVDKHCHEGELPVRLCNYTDVYHNETVHPGLELMEATATLDEVTRFRLRTGDTVFTKDSETADDIGIPAYVTADADDFVCGYHLAIARPNPREVHPKYLFWWLNSREAAQLWEVRASGVTRVGLRQTDIRQLPMLVVPDLLEQRAIADFLDRETAQIDAMVDAQERLVALLEERRAAAITRAITLGLDEAAELNDSGVDWLGRVPSHWTVQRLGRLGRSTIGLTYRPEDIVDDPDAGTLVLRASNIQNGRISLEDSVYVSSGIPPALRLRAGDILICARNGSARLVGKNARITRDLEGQTWGAFMTVFRSPINEFVGWVLNSSIFQQQIGLFSTSTINQLTAGTLHSFKIALPPEEEQQQIISFLERTTIRIDAMISKSLESIALMKERRAAVISAAVTGRIDVRTGIEQVERELEEARV